MKHNKVGEADEPAIYRINDDLVSLFLLIEMLKRKMVWVLKSKIPLGLTFRCRNTPLRYTNGLEAAGNHMFQMMFKFSFT